MYCTKNKYHHLSNVHYISWDIIDNTHIKYMQHCTIESNCNVAERFEGDDVYSEGVIEKW